MSNMQDVVASTVGGRMQVQKRNGTSMPDVLEHVEQSKEVAAV